MSLAFTAPTTDKMFEFIQERLWYKFEDRTDEWTAYVDSVGADSSDATTYSEYAVTFVVNTSFISAWDAITPTVAWVRKWTGGCLRDYSSGLGGFCVFQTNDTDMSGTDDSVERIY